MSKKDKKRERNYLNQNPLESLGNIAQGTADVLVKDLVGAGASDAWAQFFGVESTKDRAEKSSGDLQEGQELDLKETKEQTIEPGIDWRREIIHADKVSSSQDRNIKVKIEEILVEIKRLTESSKELEMQFKDVAVETQVVKPGKYHENFFDWIYSVIKAARVRIEDSTGWLSLMHSKKDRKYWAMFKKHGTTFGLSNERVVATQTG